MTNEINTSEGYICLFRKMTEWEWYDDANTMRVFLHCLLSANHADNSWHGIFVKQGSFITSIGKLAYRLKLSEKQIRTAINKLKKTGEVASEGTSQYTVITVKNWVSYQEKGKQKGKRRANEGRTKGEQRATNNNDNNDNNENNKKANFELFWKNYPNHKTNKKKSFEYFKEALEKTSLENLLSSVKKYKDYIEKNNIEEKFISYPYNWLKEERWLDEYNTSVDDGLTEMEREMLEKAKKYGGIYVNK